MPVFIFTRFIGVPIKKSTKNVSSVGTKIGEFFITVFVIKIIIIPAKKLQHKTLVSSYAIIRDFISDPKENRSYAFFVMAPHKIWLLTIPLGFVRVVLRG